MNRVCIMDVPCDSVPTPHEKIIHNRRLAYYIVFIINTLVLVICVSHVQISNLKPAGTRKLDYPSDVCRRFPVTASSCEFSRNGLSRRECGKETAQRLGQ